MTAIIQLTTILQLILQLTHRLTAIFPGRPALSGCLFIFLTRGFGASFTRRMPFLTPVDTLFTQINNSVNSLETMWQILTQPRSAHLWFTINDKTEQDSGISMR